MTTAFLKITERCDNACPFCFNRGLGTADRTMSAGDIVRYMSSLRALGVFDLVITGGEPLLVDDLDAVLGRLSAGGFRITVVTNGTHLTPARARKLAAAWPDVLVWSLNDVHNGQADAEVFLGDLGPRLCRYADAFPNRLSTIFVFTRATAQIVGPVLDACAEAGVPIIVQPAYLAPGHPQRDRLDPLTLPGPDWDRLVETLAPWAYRTGIASYLGFLDGLHERGDRRPASCGMGEDAIVIESDGAVFPCFHRRDLPAGNLNEDNPETIAARLRASRPELADAGCFGAHCVSLFVY